MALPGATKIEIYIAGDKVGFVNNTIQFSNRIEERSTFSFTVFDDGGRKVFIKGQPVDVYFDEELRFAGVVDRSVITRATPQGDRYHQITCIDYHYAADKRVVAAAYEKTKAGDIVKDKSGERTIGTVLAAEGIVSGGDVSRTEQSSADFEQGTLHQVTTDGNDLVLDQHEVEGTEPTSLNYAESGEDFEEGKLDGVVVGEDGLELEMGKALSFDGVDDKANIGNYPAGTNPFTIELWLKPKAADDGMFLSNGLGSHHNRIYLRISNDKTIHFYTNDASGVTAWLISNFTVTLDEWVHIAVTRSGTTGRIFIDGVEDVSGTVKGGNLDGGRDWYIGARSDNTFPHECSIRDLRIWNIARTEEDIANDMNKKLTGSESGLVHYWPMDEGTGDTIYDLAGDNDGTISGATWVDTPYYKEQGSRISPPLDLSSIGTVKTSEISWQATEPTDTSLKVETSLSTDSGETWGAWQQATNGGSIPGIVPGMNLSNAKLKTRATLETEDTSVTPVLEILSISLTGEKTGLVLVYYDDGFRVSPPLDLSAAGIAKTSAISLSATIPTGTSLSVACAINDSNTIEPDAEDYQAAVNGQPVPVITENDDLSGKFLWIKQILETEDENTTPKLHSLTVLVETNIQTIDDGPELEEAVFNYIPVSQALDALAERSGMWWRIDEHRRLHFVERAKYEAPFPAVKDNMEKGSVSVENSSAKYRNQQIIKGPVDLTSPQTEIMHGDGEQTTFTVGYPIAKVPTVEVDTGSGFVAQTVGIKGVETGKDWYWNGGDPTITQDSGGTPLGATDRIRITYQGEFPILIVSRNNTAILNRQAVETVGTGIVEDVRNEPQQSTREAAFQLAAQLLEKYSVEDSRVLKYRTWRPGLQPGQIQPVDLPDYGMTDTEVLITQVMQRDEAGRYFWYDITAVEGPEQGSWTKVFDEIVKRGELKVREGVGVGEVVIIPRQFSKTWTEEETPNIFRELYPAADLDPAETLYPSFAPEHRVRYLAWFSNGTELGRKAITQQTGADTDEIYTLTYLEAGEALGEITSFGWIGGIEATAASGTGIQVDKQAVPGGPVEKTVLESWQVEKRDYKWSA